MICAGAFLSAFVNANNADLFSYDQNQVAQELSQLQSLENYVSANPDITLSSLQAENNSLIANLNLSTNDMSGFAFSGETAFGVPSFLWGCVFSIVGVAVVYFVTDEDKDETKKAFYGCIINGVLYTAWYVLWRVVWYY
jgi:prolipoprotein diacylglyceryltransferase